MIFIFIGIVIIFTLTVISVISGKYKKELKRQDWYETFQYEFKSIGCPHEKQFKLKDITWKFAFTLKKEKSRTVNIGPISNTVHQVHYRFYCEECRKKYWFEQIGSVRDHKGLFYLRLKYLAIGGGSIMLIFIISMNVIFRLLL